MKCDNTDFFIYFQQMTLTTSIWGKMNRNNWWTVYNHKLLSVKDSRISAFLRHKNDKDYKENNKYTENLDHQPSIGCDALKIFD